MAYTVRIKSIKLVNFIGIQNGLGRKELEIDFKKLKDKNIILILGDNATGKSTLMSVLHCLPGTTDGRNKFILDDKLGTKTVVYDRSDGSRFECKIVYSPSKTGHNTKGFVTKIDNDGNETELNENGNITSYKEIVEEELGISDAVLKLANQNDVCKGQVDMTSTERKVSMSTFLPDDIYSNYYAIVDKTYKELKTRINVLVESIGRMHTEETLDIELRRVTNEINHLVEKRDKCTEKIAEYQTRIQVIKENGIIDKEKELRKEITTGYEKTTKLASRLDTIYMDNGLNNFLSRSDTSERINNIITATTEKAKKLEIELSLINNEIAVLKGRRNSISEQIQEKENSIEDLETNLSLTELDKVLKDYKDELDRCISESKGIDASVTKDTFYIGYEIINNIRSMVDSVGYYSRDLIEASCTDQYRDFKPEDAQVEKHKLLDDKAGILGKIAAIENDNTSDNTLSKRPENCTIDSCPFISSAVKLKQYQENLPKFMDKLKEIDKSLEAIEDRLRKADELKAIHGVINDIMRYVSSNATVISKLPKHDKYDTLDAIKKCILKGGSNLSECDDFEPYIEKIELRDRAKELENILIPKVSHELELIRTKGKFIDDTKADLERLRKEKDSINDELNQKNSSASSISFDIDYLKGIINALENFYDAKQEYSSLYDQLVASDEELKKLKSQLEEVVEYEEKIKEKKDKLKEIEGELQPLTRERELYKMEQLKIADNKTELDAVNADMFKCEIIRAALSVKDDGIPVGALEFFMDNVRMNANSLLSKAFNGSLYLDEFIINSKDFIIPYKTNGDRGMDVSYASSSERSFISLALTMAIIEEIVNKYTVVCLDEVDAPFSDLAKSKFVEILLSQINRSGIQQLFMITHNSSYYTGYDNVGILAFPGAVTNEYSDKDIIRIERHE